ncbi:decaprenyl-phosphate phosphoribosyltransferase [Agriterribacter sp.]|uniref:decaprenyl-phosphate phosphoribosyltransferase n=1 Tax=Agriterribacter sp. TaxID=2821509 RepID=UPI002BE4D621|nr:decaprenyl-phosphate phosphoribosyltransferase [Agriterribacter sp.]HRP55560.1 decaprenyl-phosphate phosphoribosyltransferase [Agriterribacter sp.]
MIYLKLLRPKDWAKNLFLYIPLFFAGEIFNWLKVLQVFEGFIAFCCIASSIYIINDYADKEDDKKHPEKRNRPIASGAVSTGTALTIFTILTIAGFFLAYFISTKFFSLLGIYFFLNIGYSFGLKNIPILDIFIIAIGFPLRIRSGGSIANVDVTVWLNIMIFLLALFMAAGKRRDDVLLKITSGDDMRKAVKGYTLDFLNALLALISSVMIVSYFMYTVSQNVIERHGTSRLYLTSLFVMAGIMRYLQIIYVNADSGSPTKILYKDRFIQISLVLWMVSFYVILYIK